MLIGELDSAIKEKNMQPFYVFTGEEIFVRDRKIKDIAKAANAEIVRAESVSSIYNKIQNKCWIAIL